MVSNFNIVVVLVRAYVYELHTVVRHGTAVCDSPAHNYGGWGAKGLR